MRARSKGSDLAVGEVASKAEEKSSKKLPDSGPSIGLSDRRM
jgi:hypothetical protein